MATLSLVADLGMGRPMERVLRQTVGLYADARDEDLDRVTMAVFVGRHLGRGQSGFRRVGLMGKFLATAGRSVQQLMESHCR